MSTDQFNAQLFLRLAEFVVWAERHDDFAAHDAEFATLRERCAAALVPGSSAPWTWPADRLLGESA